MSGLPLPTLHVLSGLKVPRFVQQRKLDELRDLDLYPDDVWITAYPKCGITWASQIARLIKNRGVQNDVRLDVAVPWPENILHEEKLGELSQPRLLKSHFPYHLFPCGQPHTTPCKYIYVTRNPKDTLVSLFFFMKQAWERDLEWDDFFERFMKGDVFYGDYFDNLLSWLPHKDDKNMLFLRYEDMKKDLPQTVSKIASFMEIELQDETIAKIVELTTFKTMKGDNTANLSWLKNMKDEKGEGKFLRKGVVGDWKNFLSAQQSAEIDTKCTEKLKDTGFEFDYDTTN